MALDLGIYFALVVFFMVPLTVLLVGAILAYFKASYRRVIGAFLVAVGVAELSIWLFIAGFAIGSLNSPGVPVYIVTVFTGIVSLLFACKIIQN